MSYIDAPVLVNNPYSYLSSICDQKAANIPHLDELKRVSGKLTDGALSVCYTATSSSTPASGATSEASSTTSSECNIAMPPPAAATTNAVCRVWLAGAMLERVRFDQMYYRHRQPASFAKAKRMSFFVGQAPLELYREEGGCKLKTLINWAAGFDIVEGELDVHESTDRAKASSSSLSRPNHTGCATVSIFAPQRVAQRVIELLNERAFATDADSIWISDRLGLEKSAAQTLQQCAGVNPRSFRAQRLVIEFSKKKKGGTSSKAAGGILH